MAYQWAPDYSSAIDTSKHPDAVWMPAEQGGGNEGGPGRPAGWYSGGSINEASGVYMPGPRITGVTDNGSSDGSIADNYWALRDAGLWNLQDPNSGTWKYLQAKSGGGDVLRDPNALFKGLAEAGLAGGAATSRDEAGRAQVEGALREALQGANPEFVSQFAPAVGQAVENYWTVSKQSEHQGIAKDLGDQGRVFRDMFTQTPLGVALAAFTFGASAGAGAGAGASEGGGAAAGGATAGGLEGAGAGLEGLTAADLGAEALPFTTNPSLADLGGLAGSETGMGAGSLMPAAVPESPFDLSNQGLFQTGPGQFEQLPMTAGGSGPFLGTSGFGTGATIAEGGTGASGGATSGSNIARNASGASAAARILRGEGTLEDYIQVGGQALPGLVGAYGANQQSKSLEALSREYMALGAPSRARFEASFQPGFSMANEPGYKDALDQTTKSFLHKASVGGNPAESPNAWEQTLKDVSANFAFPALQDYRRVNAGAGGLAALTSAAPAAATGAIQADANVLNAFGGAAADVFNPPKRLRLSDLMAAGY